MKVLLIEDCEDIREMLVNMMTEMGYEVKAIEEYGNEIVNRIEDQIEDGVDLIVSDYNFSAFCRFDRVKEIALKANLPVVLQTSEIETYSDYQVSKINLLHDLEPTIIRALEDHSR